MPNDVDIFNLAVVKLLELMEGFAQVKAERKVLDQREAALNEDWKAWYHIYDKERPPALPETLEDAVIPDASVALEGSTAPMLPPPEEIENRLPIITNNYGAKTAAVRQILADAGETGILPKELKAELEKRGIKVSESFAGNTLFRLRKRGKVFLDSGGRYVLSSFLPREECA